MAFQLGDPRNTALVLLHMQNDIVHEKAEWAQRMGFAETVKEGRIISNIRRLMEACRAAKAPVVHIVVDAGAAKQFQMPHRGYFLRALATGEPILQKGSWGARIHDELTPLPDEPVLGNFIFSAFASSNLHELLRARNISQLILTGVATEFVVDATSWAASDYGYDVIVPRDCCCGQNTQVHEDALRRLAARADITTADELIAALSSV